LERRSGVEVSEEDEGALSDEGRRGKRERSGGRLRAERPEGVRVEGLETSERSERGRGKGKRIGDL